MAKLLSRLGYIAQIAFSVFGILVWLFQAIRAFIQGVDAAIVILLFCIVAVCCFLLVVSIKEYKDFNNQDK